MKTIQLGEKIDYGAEPSVAPVADKKEKMSYPTLYLSGVEGLDELAGKGIAQIEYRMRSCTVREDDEGRDYSAEIEIISITPLTPKEAEKGASAQESGEAMGKLLEEAID